MKHLKEDENSATHGFTHQHLTSHDYLRQIGFINLTDSIRANT